MDIVKLFIFVCFSQNDSTQNHWSEHNMERQKSHSCCKLCAGWI